MILPPKLPRSPRRQPVGLYPDRPDWHTFVLGVGAFMLVAAVCLFVAVRLAA